LIEIRKRERSLRSTFYLSTLLYCHQQDEKERRLCAVRRPRDGLIIWPTRILYWTTNRRRSVVLFIGRFLQWV